MTEITAESLEQAIAMAVTMGNNRADMGRVGRIVVINAQAPPATRAVTPDVSFDPSVGKLGEPRGRFEDVSVDLGGANVRENSKDFYFQRMAQCNRARRLLLVVTSTLNQPVQVAVVGAIGNQPESAGAHYRIGEAITVPSNDRTSVPVDLGRFWHPWIGVVVLADTSVTAPTSGDVKAEAYLVNER